MAENKTPAVDEVEQLLVLQQHRAKPAGTTKMKRFVPGDKYQQSGLDKLEVIGTGKCTRDLKADVPKNSKRIAPGKGFESYLNPVEKLCTKIDDLIDALGGKLAPKTK